MAHNAQCPHCGHENRNDSNERPALAVGVLLGGRYQLGSVIGFGGFGITYAAWDETLQTPVAIKEYFPESYLKREDEFSDEVIVPQERQREFFSGLIQFLHEAQVLAKLGSMPGAVHVQNHFEENGTAYIVMEFLRGRTLREYALSHPPQSRELLDMLRPVFDALTELHSKGIMHRDITPHNLMVLEDGSVKLIDFGACGEMDVSTGDTYVTECYAPIEQYSPDGQGAWTDVYGMCATIYSVLTGVEPPPARERLQHDKLIPVDRIGVRMKNYQAQAISRGLVVRPENRTRSMVELRAALYGLATPEELRRRRVYRRRVTAAAAVIVAIMLLILMNFTVGLPLGGDMRYAVWPDGLHILHAEDTGAEVEIPGQCLGMPVTAVGRQAFSGLPSLKRVTIPGSVKKVGEMAFSGCERLEMVTAEEGVAEFGGYSFASCPALHTVILPQSLERVSANALDGASPLLTVWGARGGAGHEAALTAGWTFADPAEYDAQAVDGGMMITACRSEDERLVLPSYYMNGQPVVALADESDLHVAFPYQVDAIVFPAFLETLSMKWITCSASEYTLGSGTKAIGPDAFNKNSGKSYHGIRVHLPEGFEEIGEMAFFLAGIEEIEFPPTLRRIGRQAFDCADLKTVVLPDSVTELGQGVFAYSDVTSVTLSASLESLPREAFQYSDELKTVTFREGLRRIEDEAFYKCESLEAVCLPKGLEEIGEEAFAYCLRLKYVDIPESVTVIAEDAFDACSSSLIIGGYPGSAAQRYAQEKGIRFEDKTRYTVEASYSDQLFLRSDDRDELICPSYSEKAGKLITAFVGTENSAWSLVQLPAFVESIASDSFAGNTVLEGIDLPRSLNSISFGAFENCTALERMKLPPMIEKIEWNAFRGCISLREVCLPDSLTYLGEEAFAGCMAVEVIELSEGLTSLDKLTFAQNGVKRLTVPGSVRSCNATFYGCEALESIVFEEGAAHLHSALQLCTSLRSVTIPASMKSVSRGTLRGCKSLEHVFIHSMDVDLDEQIHNGVYDSILSPEYFVFERGADEAPLFADCPEVTIHAYPGSTAERYAAEHGLKFEPLARDEVSTADK